MFRLLRLESSSCHRIWTSLCSKKPLKTLHTSSCQFAFPSDTLPSIDDYSPDEQDEFNRLRNTSFQPITGGRNVMVLQPFIKWGPLKKRDTTPELQLNESVSLINTLRDWNVVGKEVVSLTSFCRMRFFGTGKLDELKQKIQNNPNCTAIFISVNQLKSAQHLFLEQFFEKPVYDRYLIVMQIFREHAFTEEAKLQIALAEVPYLYSRMSHIHSESLSRIGSSAALISGTTIHTPKDTRKMILHRYESRIKDSLSKLRSSRTSARQRRRYEESPTVAVIGYTNAGKTSVVKALSGNEKLSPQMHLFATLDVSFHMGRLPCNLKVYFVDTIGFISDIPTYLIEPFLVTLEDAINADVLVHVQDVSHPDWLFQRDRVTETIEKLNVDKKLFKYVIPVANKMDLLNPGEDKIIPSDMVQISCAKSAGIDELQERIEELVIEATGRIHVVIKTKTGSEEYSFLTKEAAVADIVADSNDANYSLLSGMNDVIENFYGVYLLYNISDKYKGRTYIGFTVDPNRRISQHNKGVHSGGARKTSCKGPWEMILIIHGFLNEISALRFEWAWQNPKKSRRLRHLPLKVPKEKPFDFALRILSEMLRVGPWNRLPLTIRWVNEKYARDFSVTSLPPLHMPITYGRVTIQKVDSKNNENDETEDKATCLKCHQSILQNDLMICVNPHCNISCHVICFSKYFTSADDSLIPVEGKCPSCGIQILWGDLVRRKKGCYKNLLEETSEELNYTL